MSFLLGVIAGIGFCVLGGYGLYQVAYRQGYVDGFEDAEHPDGGGEIKFKGDA